MGPGQRRVERHHLALAAIVAFAAATYAWHLGSAHYSVYYSSAVRSMSGSWHALLFGAFDPGSTITVDKVPGAFVVQALFARVLGFHAWVLVLPQVLEGVVAIVVLYRLVRRWRGVNAALVAAAVFATTPIVASVFGHTMEDGALACCAVLAVDRLHVAITQGRLQSLLWAAVWVGVGFEMKMLQAWMLLPALVGAYVLCAPGSLRRRIADSGLALGVVVVLSSWWVVLLELVPASHRPYVDGSFDNSAFTMVFGYNGLDRLGIHVAGAVENVYPGIVSTPPIAPWHALLSGRLATQISWLLPIALATVVIGLWMGRRLGRTAPDRAAFVVFALWLLPLVVLLSAVNVPHAAYLSALAAPLSGLAGVGLVALASAPRRAVVVVIALQAGWAAWVWTSYDDFAPGALWLTLALAVLAVLAVIATSATRSSGRRTAVALVSVLIAPTVWTLSTFDTTFAGTEVEAGAGPAWETHPGVVDPGLLSAFGERGRSFVVPSTQLSSDARDIWSAASAPGVEYPLTTAGWYLAQSYLLAGEKVLPTGGFSLKIPAPSLDRFLSLLSEGRVRFVLAGSGAVGGFVDKASANGEIVTWVVEHCTHTLERDYTAYGVPATGVFLYDCARGSG